MPGEKCQAKMPGENIRLSTSFKLHKENCAIGFKKTLKLCNNNKCTCALQTKSSGKSVNSQECVNPTVFFLEIQNYKM